MNNEDFPARQKDVAMWFIGKTTILCFQFNYVRCGVNNLPGIKHNVKDTIAIIIFQFK